MLCEICGKNEATIHIEEISDGKSKTLHICGECMAKNPTLGGMEINAFNLGDIICNLAGSGGGKPGEAGSGPSAGSASEPLIECGACGWTSEKLHKTGRLGCGECYHYFRELLLPALRTMHRGLEHTGKHPGGGTSELSGDRELVIQISALKSEQKKCIASEDYEQAAVLRDKILALEEQLKGSSGGKEK